MPRLRFLALCHAAIGSVEKPGLFDANAFEKPVEPEALPTAVVLCPDAKDSIPTALEPVPLCYMPFSPSPSSIPAEENGSSPISVLPSPLLYLGGNGLLFSS
jgi:hypothetical protein